MRGLKLIPLIAAFVLVLGLPSVRAEQAAGAKSSKLCLGLLQIGNIEYMDNRNIVFRMVNGDYYVNQLPYSCPNLTRDKAIMYKTSLSELCNLDIINVLDTIGGGFEQVGACGLGKFKPITKAEYEALRHKSAEK